MKNNKKGIVAMVLMLGTLLVGCGSNTLPYEWEVMEQRADQAVSRIEEVTEENTFVKEFILQNNRQGGETYQAYIREVDYYGRIDSQRGVCTLSYETTYNEAVEATTRFIQEIETYYGVDVTSFIKEYANKSETEIGFVSKVFDDFIVTVRTQKLSQEEEHVYVEFNFLTRQIREGQDFYQNIMQKVQTEDFVLSNFVVGIEKEMVEISNADYLMNGTWVNYRIENAVFNIEPKVSYRLYTDREDVEKVRVIINKQKGKPLQAKDLAPFYGALELLGVENGEDILQNHLVQLIDNDTIGTKKGKVGYLNYQYKGIKDKEYMNQKTMIEIVLW